MAKTRQQRMWESMSWLGARRSAAQPYRESELEVPTGGGGGGGETEPTPPSALRTGGVWARLLTAPGADAESIDSANTLRDELARVTGTSPPDRTSWASGVAGIRVGLRSEWLAVAPSLPDWGSWDYALVVVGGQPYVLGRNQRGLASAVRRVVHGLGYRCLAPGANWEVFPATSADYPFPTESPRVLPLRFFSGLGSGCGLMTYQTSRLTSWFVRNGIEDDGKWDLGHAWGRIAQADPSGFASHPEWSGGGVPSSNGNKLCAYEPGLQAEALSWAQGRLTIVGPDLATVSMAAADGTIGWTSTCSGSGEHTTRTPSDRQLHLANYVQAGLRTAGSTVHVGVLAYGDMSAPPVTETVDPDVVVVYASQYMVQGQTPEQVRNAYVAAGASLVATYGYPSVWTQDFDEPGVAVATRRDKLTTERDRLVGAVGWTGEGSPSWAPHGRWYYALAGYQHGDDPLTRWDEWPSMAFPGCTTEATAWADLVASQRALSTDAVHRLAATATELLDAAAGASAGEFARALDLARYAIAMDLQRRYKVAPSATTLEPLLRWVYRVVAKDGYDALSYRCPYFTTPWQTDRKAVAALYGQSDLSPFTPPWSSLAGTTEGEIRTALANAVANNPLQPFAPVAYSRDLVQVAGLTHSGTRGTYVYSIKPTVWYLNAPGEVVLSIRGGIAFTNKGPDRVVVSELASGSVVADLSIPADGVTRDYPVSTVAQRQYRVDVTPAGGVKVDWPVGTAFTLITDEAQAPFQASSNFYFYVPVGTTQVGFYANSGTIRFFNNDNQQVGSNIVAAANYYVLDVPEDRDGQAWKYTGPVGKFGLLTVPPEVALAEDELLLPREVAEADGLALSDATPAPSRDYTVIEYPTDLARPSGTLTATGSRGDYIYGTRPYTLWLSAVGLTTTYTIKGGVASTTKGPDTVSVWDTVAGATVATWSVPGDRVARPYELPTTDGRLYRLDVVPAGGVDVDWAAGVRTTGVLEASVSKSPFIGSFSASFYVPAGVTQVGWYADGGTVRVYDNANVLRAAVVCANDFHSVAVPTGQDRKVWRFTGAVGRVEFETVPRSWARAAGELLLPAAVIAADGL